MRRTFRIGLTGGMGSGKSSVARLFKRWGALWIETDRLAHEALGKNTAAYRRIVRVFGKSVLGKAGRMDRKKLGAAVFGDARKRRRLERMVHPYVFRRVEQEIRRRRPPIAVIEVPLLFETGYARRVDRVITVAADPVRVYARLKRRGYTPRQIRARLGAQWSLALKKKRSDFVILNNNRFRQTARRAREVWNQIKREVVTYASNQTR